MKRILTHICDDLIAYDHVWSGRLDLNSFSGQLRIGKDSKAKEREKEDTAEPLQKDHPDERPPHLCLIYRVVFKEEFHCIHSKSTEGSYSCGFARVNNTAVTEIFHRTDIFCPADTIFHSM